MFGSFTEPFNCTVMSIQGRRFWGLRVLTAEVRKQFNDLTGLTPIHIFYNIDLRHSKKVKFTILH